MSRADEALAALKNRDWSGAELVKDKPRKSFVFSTRLSGETSDRVLAEAERRGTTPSDIIRDLVEAGLAETDESATVRLADVRRALDQLAERRAA